MRSWGICGCSELAGRQDWPEHTGPVTGAGSQDHPSPPLWTGEDRSEGTARAALLNAGLAWPQPDKAAGRNR